MATTTSTNASIKRALNQAKHKFSVNTLYDEISSAANNMNVKVADVLVDEINTNYNEFTQYARMLHDAQDRSDTVIYKEKYGNGYRVIASGSQVIYDEFGTGTEGENQPHPEKNKYGLEPYNSGFYIKTNKNGVKYWTYYSDNRGKYVTSHGVPAGMFMYKSFSNVVDNIAANIALDEMLKASKRIAKRK